MITTRRPEHRYTRSQVFRHAVIKPKRDALDAPTVLLCLEGEPTATSLAGRLNIFGLAVEQCGADALVQTAFVTAPDLIVIGGAAAADGGHALLEKLSEHHATALLPVAVIGSGGAGHNARAALRHGVVAVVDRTSGPDRMARTIKALASELPERTGESKGVLDEAELAGLVALLTESRRFGVLTVTDDQNAPLMHMLVRGDRPVHEIIEELLTRLKALGRADHGTLRYEFQESGRARIADAPSQRAESSVSQQLANRRIVLVERNPTRADLTAQALRAHGATVAVIGGDASDIDIAREILPEVVVVDDEGVGSWANETMRELRRDGVLCWASLLVVKESEIFASRRPDIGPISAGVLDLVQPDLELVTRVRARASIDARLELVGPARTLRALAAAKRDLRVRVVHPRVKVELELVEGLVGTVTARPLRRARKTADGPGALATLLSLSSGRVHVEHAPKPSSQVLTPIDEALAKALDEEPAIAKSAPPPPSGHAKVFPGRPHPKALAPQPLAEPVKSAAPEGSQVARLVDRLEKLLGSDEWEDEATEQDAFGEPFEDLEEEDTTHTWTADLAKALRARMGISRRESRPDPASAKRREPTMQLGLEDDAPKPPALEVLSELEEEIEQAKQDERLDDDDITSLEMRAGDLELPEPTGDGEDDEPPTLIGKRSARREELDVTASDEDELPSYDEDLGDERTIREAPDSDSVTVPEEPARPLSQSDVKKLLESSETDASADEDAVAFFELQQDLPPLVEPAPPPNRRFLMVGLLVCLLAFAGGGAGAWYLTRGRSPDVDTARASMAPGQPADTDDAEGPPPPTGDGDSPDDVDAPPDGPETDTPSGAATPPDVAAVDPDAPLEGTGEGFELEAFGVELDERTYPRALRRRRARGLVLQANRERIRGQHEAARGHYLEVLSFAPRNLPATVGLTRIYLAQDDVERALAMAQYTVRLRDRAALGWVLLGDAYLEGGRRDAARRAFERAVELDRRHRGARRRLAALASDQ